MEPETLNDTQRNTELAVLFQVAENLKKIKQPTLRLDQAIQMGKNLIRLFNEFNLSQSRGIGQPIPNHFEDSLEE